MTTITNGLTATEARVLAAYRAMNAQGKDYAVGHLEDISKIWPSYRAPALRLVTNEPRHTPTISGGAS